MSQALTRACERLAEEIAGPASAISPDEGWPGARLAVAWPKDGVTPLAVGRGTTRTEALGGLLQELRKLRGGEAP